MLFNKMTELKKIKEFLDLVENHKVDIRHYKHPVLVWGEQDGTIYYSFWEEEMLDRFGLENVDGWDYEEDKLFCPDWISDPDDDEDDLDDEDDCPVCLPKIDFSKLD